MRKKLLVSSLGLLLFVSVLSVVPETDTEATQVNSTVWVRPTLQMVSPASLKDVIDSKPEIVASVNESIIVEPTTEEVVESTTEEITTEEVVVEEEVPVEPTTEEVTEEESETVTSESGMTYYGDFELTAYIETGNPCADGVYPSVGYTVACNDPNLWHKWIHIEGYGDYYVHDTGGMASNVIDIFVGSYDEAIQFGRRYASVSIIN